MHMTCRMEQGLDFSCHSFTVQYHCASSTAVQSPDLICWLLYLHLTFLHNRRMVPFMLEVGGTQGWQSKWSRQAISIYSPPLPQPHSGWSASCLCLLPLCMQPLHIVLSFKIKEISLSYSHPSDRFSLHFE